MKFLCGPYSDVRRNLQPPAWSQALSASSESPWWDPRKRRDRQPFLAARGLITRAVRAWLEAEGLVEVETAGLQVSPGNEAHLHAFATQALTTDGQARPMYLHTSPEFACKKLLASGEPAIFTLGKVWRNRERGPLHHPEFTMLEWYRTGAAYEVLMDDCAALMRRAAEAAGTTTFNWRGSVANPFAEPERLTVAEAFERHAGIDLFGDLPAQARACGGERANCFGELTDVAEQRRRFEIEMAEKQRLYGETYPIDDDFLDALALLPPASRGGPGV